MPLRWVAASLVVLASCKSPSPPEGTSSRNAKQAAPVVGSVAGASSSVAAGAGSSSVAAGSGAAGSSSVAAGSAAAGSASPGARAPEPGTVDTAQSGSGAQAGSGAMPVIHGDKWQDVEEGGRNFAAFKETWVYVDGVPRGAMLFAELPADLPERWKDDVESLDFKPGDPGPHTKPIQFLRWRLAEYFTLIGIDVKKIKMVYLHGSGYVAIPGDRFRKFADSITFDLTGNDLSKTKFYWSKEMPTNTSYDRYAVVSVFIDKPPLTLDVHNNPYIDGVEVTGVPYHGAPERGGFRVYVDYKLAMVVKRNELGAVGRVNNERWNLMTLLAARGVKVKPVAGDLVVSKHVTEQRRERLDQAYVANIEIGVNSQASGTMLLGKDNRAATALHLYTKGHVPPVLPLPVMQRDGPPHPTETQKASDGKASDPSKASRPSKQ
jgi:hypothetical protein